jgi:hypothetical protein|tara:strand:+ start:60 stop:506 length:447 start_codon:yes stop_codon:yes gene_type:complete
MKIIKYTLSISIIVIFSIIGIGIYFAGQLSAKYPPIENYNFEYSKNQFEKKLNRIDTKNEYKITFTDTTGLDLDSEYSFYFNILVLKTKDKYLLKFKSDKSFFKDEQIELSLIGLTNEQTNKVIYENNEDASKVRLAFEKTILKELKK